MIRVEQIARLAELFDRYNNALDPLSEDARQAKGNFDGLTESLHSTHAPDLQFANFRYELVRDRREYLRKNRPAWAGRRADQSGVRGDKVVTWLAASSRSRLACRFLPV